MSSGLICVSLCSETAEDMLAKVLRVENSADIIELRFDCLAETEIEKLKIQISNFRSSVPLVATYRSPEQGGRSGASIAQRKEFWGGLPDSFLMVDLEEDIFDDVTCPAQRIVSYHDHRGEAAVGQVYERLMALGADTVKIAVQARDATDAIPVWRLLKHGGSVVPIGMGEAGKWTRILGLAHGSAMTYGSADVGEETASGQITFRDLAEVYCVRDLNRKTKVYGVIGDPVGGSLSPHIHNAAFAAAGLNAVFIPLLVKDLEAFFRRMVRAETREVELNFSGFAVTMPHKQAIIPYLDTVDPDAMSIGAVNTVNIVRDALRGSNTDAEGFIRPLKQRLPDLGHARVIVLGAGGAARACIHALREAGANVSVAARNADKGNDFARELSVSALSFSDLEFEVSGRGVDILVNATPIGMEGVTEYEPPVTADDLNSVKLVYDLVTSPNDTPLVREARKAGVLTITGDEMLVEQAAIQFEIWTRQEAPIDVMRRAARARSLRMRV